MAHGTGEPGCAVLPEAEVTGVTGETNATGGTSGTGETQETAANSPGI
jgi:hypothetical protein